jgi:hypothetical protein
MPSIEGSDPATADGEEARSWGQVPLQRILIGGPPTTTDDLRDLIEPSLRVLTASVCPVGRPPWVKIGLVAR